MLVVNDSNLQAGAVRAFRALRPLRSLRLFSGLQAILDALWASVPYMLSIVALKIFFMTVLGTMGTALFAGSLTRACESDPPLESHVAIFNAIQTKFEEPVNETNTTLELSRQITRHYIFSHENQVFSYVNNTALNYATTSCPRAWKTKCTSCNVRSCNIDPPVQSAHL